ncbi:MAG: hypothetical protein J7L47_00660, partial [Candidatus Odinarchaeota archaeon]|nr:hypothetical protein [Candidatus Odinarchaeota archaeon]
MIEVKKRIKNKHFLIFLILLFLIVVTHTVSSLEVVNGKAQYIVNEENNVFFYGFIKSKNGSIVDSERIYISLISAEYDYSTYTWRYNITKQVTSNGFFNVSIARGRRYFIFSYMIRDNKISLLGDALYLSSSISFINLTLYDTAFLNITARPILYEQPATTPTRTTFEVSYNETIIKVYDTALLTLVFNSTLVPIIKNTPVSVEVTAYERDRAIGNWKIFDGYLNDSLTLDMSEFTVNIYLQQALADAEEVLKEIEKLENQGFYMGDEKRKIYSVLEVLENAREELKNKNYFTALSEIKFSNIKIAEIRLHIYQIKSDGRKVSEYLIPLLLIFSFILA